MRTNQKKNRKEQTEARGQSILAGHCGHLTEVRHQGCPVADAQGTRVHGLPARTGREGEVGGDPGDGGDETRNTLDFHAESSMLCVI